MKAATAILLIFLIGLCCSCNSSDPKPKLFTRVSPGESGINFQNTVIEDERINILTYEYLYNGAGVGIGDLNNDGLPDLFLTSNSGANGLYLNEGNLHFREVAKAAGVAGRPGWKTGVTIADVNGDGWLDVYVCYSGPVSKNELSNALYINNLRQIGGIPTFSEKAMQFGLDAPFTFSTQSSFFDYDNDGDLDMFLLNHGTQFYSPFHNTNKLRNKRHPQFGNRLYRNDRSHFSEVSTEAGIHGGGINFGLGISISDLNNDGWQDIYVTNDYEEQDYFYLNNGNGTFRECSKQSFGHISMFGMGTDIADYNNDGRTDLIEGDMIPEDNHRQKLLRGADDYNKYTLMVDSGFHHQNMRNSLQLNRGIGPGGVPVFSEIGQLAGVSNTDWSWAMLFADFDNDGWKDLFVSNGYLRDYTDRDFLKFSADKSLQEARASRNNAKIFEIVQQMPSNKISNYVFKNKADLSFQNMTAEWGIILPAVSSGAAYADLDNDGDLDLLVMNTNQTATLWKNNAEQISGNHFLKIRLEGYAANRFGIGAKVEVITSGLTQLQEQMPARGYLSSVDYTLNFGLGSDSIAGEVRVTWPDGKRTILTQLKAGSIVTAKYSQAVSRHDSSSDAPSPVFTDITASAAISFVHKEDHFIDYEQEPLLPYRMSRLGPNMCKADVDNDGLEDFFIGGASRQGGKLYLQKRGHTFAPSESQPWIQDSLAEDIGSIFIDADGDEDADLYVVSGGNQFGEGSSYYQDRLYINEGKGVFTKAPPQYLPKENISGSCVIADDFDKDGDPDLFIAGRLLPGKFPSTPSSLLFKNNGKGKFENVTELLPDSGRMGMVTSATWADMNNDGFTDLVVAGEWMPVKVYVQSQGRFVLQSNPSLNEWSGLWSALIVKDLDNDGDMDIVAGNNGTNMQWKPSLQEPIELYFGAANNNGHTLPIMCAYVQGKSYPVASLDQLTDQYPSLKKIFYKYKDYADAQINNVLEKKTLSAMQSLNVTCAESSIFENNGKGVYIRKALPTEAQFSVVRKILAKDYTQDGLTDLLIVGNSNAWKVHYGKMDASFGLLLVGNRSGGYKVEDFTRNGFFAAGETRDLVEIKTGDKRSMLIVSVNDGPVSVFEIK